MAVYRQSTRSYNIEDENVIKTLSKQAIDRGMNLKNYVEHILTEVATKGKFITKTK